MKSGNNTRRTEKRNLHLSSSQTTCSIPLLTFKGKNEFHPQRQQRQRPASSPPHQHFCGVSRGFTPEISKQPTHTFTHSHIHTIVHLFSVRIDNKLCSSHSLFLWSLLPVCRLLASQRVCLLASQFSCLHLCLFACISACLLASLRVCLFAESSQRQCCLASLLALVLSVRVLHSSSLVSSLLRWKRMMKTYVLVIQMKTQMKIQMLTHIMLSYVQTVWRCIVCGQNEARQKFSMVAILKRSGKRALGGGIPGAIAMVTQVFSLMWLVRLSLHTSQSINQINLV
jgi:hypothetical protein